MDGQAKDSRIDAAMALLPLFRANAAKTEAARQALPEIIAALRDAGLFRVFQPPRVGGQPMPRTDWMNIVFELARACGSSAWVYMVLSSHAGMLMGFSPEVQDEVWGKDQDALLSSAVGPVGRARKAEGGYRLSGKFTFSSGCDFASWAVLGGRDIDDPAGKPLTFLVPLSDMALVDDWFTVGLAGTGSKTLLADEIFVAARRVHPAFAIAGTAAPAAFCYTTIGLAQGALDRFTDHIKARAQSRETDWPMIYNVAAEAQGKIDAARLLIDRDMREMAPFGPRAPLPPAMRARNQRDQAVATKLATEAVDALYSAAGASAIHVKSDFRRAYADTRAAALHAANSWTNAKHDGAVRFGQDYTPAW
ncbi:MAG TPA: acyl-CoA dehydrogenase family protein [Stellaceae bacterium]